MSPRKKTARPKGRSELPAGPKPLENRSSGNHTDQEPMTPPPKADLKILALLLVLALIPRLLYLVELQRSPLEDFLSLDTETHHMLAERIARDGTTGEAVFFRAPLYPYMLGLLYALFDAGLLAPRLIQLLIGALAAPLTYLLGLRLAGKKTALTASIAVSLYWTLIYFGGELLITILLVPLDLVLILLLTRRGTDRPPGAGTALAAGLVLGISALARPNILIFLPAILLWLAVVVIRGPEEREGHSVPGRLLTSAFLKPALLVLLGLALMVTPVTIRNMVKGGDRVLIASQGGINFFLGNNPQSNGRSAAAPMAWPEIPQEVKERHRDNVWVKEIIWISARHIAERELGRTDLKPSEVSGFWFGEAFDFISSRPGDALGLLARKTYYLLNAYEIPSNKDMEYFIREGKLRTLQLLSLGMPGFIPFGLVAPLALLGLVLTFRDWRRHLLIHLFLATYCLSIILFFINARYRVPLLPVLLIYASIAVFELIRRLRDKTSLKRWRRILLPLILLAVFLAVSNTRFFNVRDDILLGTLHYNLANHYVDSDDLERAETAYLEALRLNPLFPGAHYNLGNIYFDRKDYGKAEEHYLRAVEQSGGMADALINLGIISFTLGRDEEAVTRLRDGLRLAPGSAEGRYNLGNALSRLDRQQEAVAAFELALKNHPGMWQAAFNMGNSYYALQDLERAAAAYRRTLVSKPDHAPARCNLGIALLQLGQKDQAVTALEKAVRADPDLSRAHYWLAQLYLERGERQKAIEELRQTVRTEPRNRKAAAMLSELQETRR